MSEARLYQTPEEMQEKIEIYFKDGMRTKKVIIGKKDNQQVVELPIPTITGLALFLGFASRQSLYDYSKNYKNFSYTIKKAKTQMEMYYEEALQVGNTIGAIFALKNFGWTDKQEIEHSGKINRDINQFDGVDTKTKEKMLKMIEDNKNADTNEQ